MGAAGLLRPSSNLRVFDIVVEEKIFTRNASWPSIGRAVAVASSGEQIRPTKWSDRSIPAAMPADATRQGRRACGEWLCLNRTMKYIELLIPLPASCHVKRLSLFIRDGGSKR